MDFIKMFVETASWFDWLLFLGVMLSMLLGLWRGFVRESLAVVAWITGIMLVLYYVDDVSYLLSSWIHVDSIRMIISGLLLLVAMFILVQIFKVGCLWLVDKAGIKSLDHVLGGGFGVFRGLLIALLVTILTARVGFAENPWWSDSVLTPVMLKINQNIPKYLPKHLQETWQQYITIEAKEDNENVHSDNQVEYPAMDDLDKGAGISE